MKTKIKCEKDICIYKTTRPIQYTGFRFWVKLRYSVLLYSDYKLHGTKHINYTYVNTNSILALETPLPLSTCVYVQFYVFYILQYL